MLSLLIILMTALASQNVHSKVIIVNTSRGNESTKCCTNGECPCSSLSTALQNVTNNTIINITSEEIKLEGDVMIGSGNLTNITITSQMAMITCSSNKDTISCLSCDDVTISGISWRNCSLALGNTSVVSCTFQDLTIIVSGSIRLEQSLGSLQISNTYYSGYVNFTISGSTFYSLTASDPSYSAQWNITISNSTFMAESLASAVNFDIDADVWYSIYMVNITVVHFFNGIRFHLSANKQNISISLLSSVFIGNIGNALMNYIHSKNSNVLVLISDTEFTDVVFPGDKYGSILDVAITTDFTSSITLKNVNFTNNFLNISEGIVSITAASYIIVNMTNVNFIANEYRQEDLFDEYAAVYIETVGSYNKLLFNHCKFINNTFSQGAKLLYINGHTSGVSLNNLIIDKCSFFNNTIYDNEEILHVGGLSPYNVTIVNTVFYFNTVNSHIINAEAYAITVYITTSDFVGNTVKSSCIYLAQNSQLILKSSQFVDNIGNCVSGSQAIVIILSSNFTGNTGSCIYLSWGDLHFNQHILFYNNTADRGAALHIDQATKIYISDSTIQFLNNSALLGGAIFVEFSFDCLQNGIVFMTDGSIRGLTFKDNVARARYSGDALYYSVSKDCEVNTNTSDPTSLMYAPYHFNYSQLNSTNCCDISCSQINAKFPAVTSPHYLILCGDNIKQLDNITYYIGSNSLWGM